MTTLRVPGPTTGTTASPTDLRRYSRWLLAALLPIGPAAVAVLRYVLPYNTVDSTKEIVHKVAADQSGQSIVVWLGFVGVLALIPGMLAVARLTRSGAPRLTAGGLLLTIPGYICLTWLMSSDLLLWAGVHEGISQTTLIRLYDAAHPTTAIAGIVFVIGHVFGTILLGAAMWCSRRVPRWAAVITVVAQPLHFVAAVVVASHGLDLVAWGLNAVGFAVVAVVVLRTHDDDWDLPPG